MRCGKLLNTRKTTAYAAPPHALRLADAGFILYLWRPAVRPAKFHAGDRKALNQPIAGMAQSYGLDPMGKGQAPGIATGLGVCGAERSEAGWAEGV